MLMNEGDRLTRAIVCPPKTEYFNVDSCQAHNIPEAADRDKAILQHAQLRSRLQYFGCEVIEIDELTGHPNSLFTRDMAIVTSKGYIKANMGIDTRKGEEAWIAQALDAIGEPCAGEIRDPGTVEGGDVIVFGSVAFIGRTQRTNEEGITQISHILETMDYEVRVAKLPDTFLHLDQAVGVLGPGRLIYCKDIFSDDLFKGFDAIPFSCTEFNVNFICLGEDEIISSEANLGIIKEAERLGMTAHVIDLSEFWKGAGGPNCLIMPVERK